MAASSSSTLPPQHQVFINFRGEDIRHGFISHLVAALKRRDINFFFDELEDRGEPLDTLLKRIVMSRIALAIFSKNYTDSNWCLKELDMIKECMDEGILVVIPIFYKVDPSTVRNLKGDFGDKLWILAKGDEKKKRRWDQILNSIPNLFGITVDDKSDECQKINEIVKAVERVLFKISSMVVGSQNVPVDSLEDSGSKTFSGGEKHRTFGTTQRLKELEDKLDCHKHKGTRIIGVVGMPGIGKTTLMKELFEIWQRRFKRYALIDKIRVKSKDSEFSLPTFLVEELLSLGDQDHHTDNGEDPFELYKTRLLERKVFVILDEVSKKEQIDALLGRRDWICEGSRIVIATSDMSLTNGVVDDTYTVQSLEHRHSLQLFHYHAFSDDVRENPRKEEFMKLSEKFINYARGHPLALKMLGVELHKQNVDHWKSKLEVLAESPSPGIRSVFKMSYDELSSELKDAFLDIACFRSQDKDYVESLLASPSPDPGSAEALSAVKALSDKFLINTSDGRVEMHDLLYSFSRDLIVKDPLKVVTEIGGYGSLKT